MNIRSLLIFQSNIKYFFIIFTLIFNCCYYINEQPYTRLNQLKWELPYGFEERSINLNSYIGENQNIFLSITVVDSNGRGIKNARIILKTDCFLKVFSTDFNGNTIFSGDVRFYETNPYLAAENPLYQIRIEVKDKITLDYYPMVRNYAFNFGRSLKRDLIDRFNLIDFSPIAGLPFLVYLTDLSDKKIAQSVDLLWATNCGEYSLRTDNNGELLIYFNANFINSEPYIDRKGEYILRTSAKLTLTFDSYPVEATTINVINIENLLCHKIKNEIIFFPDGYKNFALEIADYLPRMREIIKSITGTEPKQFAIVLSQKKKPLVISDYLLPENLKNYLVWPYSIIDDYPFDYYYVTVHEWAENTIAENIYFGDTKVRWVQDGLAEYIAFKFIENLTFEEKKKIDLIDDLKRVKENFEKHINTQFPNKNIITFDLASWELASERPLLPIDPIAYKLALYFWLKIEEDFGTEVIKNFLREIRQIDRPKGIDMINILAKITKQDNNVMRSKLRTFLTSDVVRKIFGNYDIGKNLLDYYPESERYMLQRMFADQSRCLM
ncbi:MAG: hypothetical protein QME58_02815 [Bacteroidota bacterium]|nr:hypothetical protein [Bacteroidota bacterium]